MTVSKIPEQRYRIGQVLDDPPAVQVLRSH